MNDDEFDQKLVAGAFSLAGDRGWSGVTVGAAARQAGLDLARARARFAGREAVLQRFGQLADAHAMTGALTQGSARDRLFDVLLRRFDFLNMHRPGVLALLRYLPLQPALARWLGRESLVSMGWMLEATGLEASGPRGALRASGLLAVWAWGARAWLRDESEDLSATMAAVDVALGRAHEFAARFAGPEGFTPEADPQNETDPPETSLPPDLPD